MIVLSVGTTVVCIGTSAIVSFTDICYCDKVFFLRVQIVFKVIYPKDNTLLEICTPDMRISRISAGYQRV